MQHDWIFDVLCDLRTYAQRNALPALAAQVDAALQTARAEIAERLEGGNEAGAPRSGTDG